MRSFTAEHILYCALLIRREKRQFCGVSARPPHPFFRKVKRNRTQFALLGRGLAVIFVFLFAWPKFHVFLWLRNIYFLLPSRYVSRLVCLILLRRRVLVENERILRTWLLPVLWLWEKETRVGKMAIIIFRVWTKKRGCSLAQKHSKKRNTQLEEEFGRPCTSTTLIWTFLQRIVPFWNTRISLKETLVRFWREQTRLRMKTAKGNMRQYENITN